MAQLLSVNVGLPREVEWKGRTVRSAIWKYPVQGRCRVRRLNLDGDAQADLAGHGGENRAVFVYQIESYRYWQDQLSRTDFIHGQFGENFTIAGLADDAICIGDRFQIGSAIFEISQPRVTCYRVGIRMDEPRMPALLTGSGRPGFYFRVLQEGDVGAGDEISKVGEASERMTIAEVNALLYSSSHPREMLERALRIEALSSGWRWSFEALLKSETTGTANGNAGLAPATATHPVAPGFRPLQIAAIDHESADVLSFSMLSNDGQPLPIALPGQYAVLRLQPIANRPPFFRSYSLSGAASAERYRISVKIEPHGAAGIYLKEQVHVGDVLEVSSPRGSFILQSGDRPVVLLSAGIGATPVLAMLHTLVANRSTRQVFWLHSARDGQHHPFASEARNLIDKLPKARAHVCYSRPGEGDNLGAHFDSVGRMSGSVFDGMGVPRDAEAYLCGPSQFMADMKEALAAFGVAPQRIYAEIFSGDNSKTPGGIRASKKAPHLPADEDNAGPLVSFARSGIVTHWNASKYQSILELAEACDVPALWSCRTGVCHNCESGLVSGAVVYGPEPLERPAAGNLLICCSQPAGDVVIDL
jgi:ferredoxin-NADP reductase/MOSC domain-containing protein YiiM